MHSPVSLRHARLLNFVDSLVRIHVERFDLGMVFREVVAVRLSSRNVFLSDLAFYRKDRLGLQQDSYRRRARSGRGGAESTHRASRRGGQVRRVRGAWRAGVLGAGPGDPGAPLLRPQRRGAHRICRRRAGDPLHGAARPAPAARMADPRPTAESGRLPATLKFADRSSRHRRRETCHRGICATGPSSEHPMHGRCGPIIGASASARGT